MNLRHFILSNDKKVQSDDDISSEGDDYPSYYYTIQNSPDKLSDKPIELRREIQRISTFAIFHKLAPGKGVPHTFVGKFVFFAALQILMYVLPHSLCSPVACTSPCRSTYLRTIHIRLAFTNFYP
jgi:hypothetical protein